MLTAAVCWTVFDPRTGAADQPALEPSVDLQVPTAPFTVDVAGGLRLVYELHATNMRREPIELQRVSVLATPGSAVLAELGAEELARRIGRPGLMPSAPDPLSVGPGQRAIVYFWIDVGSTRPEAVTHRLALSVGEPGGRRAIEVQGPRVPVPGVSPLVIGPPLAGGPWVALYDPLLMGGHRTTVIAVEGQARIPARFAIDWIRAPAPGGGAGKPNVPPDYNGFGADVLSVADARVAQVRDGQPDLDPGVSRPSQRPALSDESGNFVILDLGGSRFAVYEHLRAGSITVRPGQAVARGRRIGQLGSSGSTSIGPHLHFHVADANHTLAAEGMPFVFDRFDELGGYRSLDGLFAGEPWTPLAADRSSERRREHPPAVGVLRFK